MRLGDPQLSVVLCTGINRSNEHSIDHKPPRTARTKKKGCDLRPVLRLPRLKSTTQAESGLSALLEEDQ